MKHSLIYLFVLAAVSFGQNENPPFHFPDSVEMKTDLVYATYGSRELHLDLFLPKIGEGPFPAVVYIHGGAWRFGSRVAFRRQAAHMATKGFVGACIEYRLSGEAKFPAAVHDSKAAVRWLRANSAKYNVNPDKIGAAGGSAGGYLVAILGTTHKVAALEGNGGSAGLSSRVQAVALFNPVTDFVRMAKEPGETEPGNKSIHQLLGATFSENPKLWARASPITYVDQDSAPTLFLHGTKDPYWQYHQSVDMMERLRAVGVHAEIFTAEGAVHAFFNRPPWYQPTLERMEEFFTKILR